MSAKRIAADPATVRREAETPSRSMARALLEPATQSATFTTKLFDVGEYEADDVGADLINELRQQCKAVNGNDLRGAEQMLIAQAHTLNQLFYEMAHRSLANRRDYFPASETYMRLALKAQSQCRTSLEALSEIKNPRTVSFVRQANIANNQQVNNGTDPCRAQETRNKPNELLEVTHEQSMDAAGPRTAGRSYQAVESVGAVHGAKDGRRKAARKPK